MTESRIQRSFHPKFFMLHYLRERISQVRAFDPNLPCVWPFVIRYRDYFAKAETEIDKAFGKVEEEIPLPFTMDMKKGAKGDELYRGLALLVAETLLFLCDL